MVRKIDMVKGEMSVAAYIFNSLKTKLDADQQTINTSATNRGTTPDETQQRVLDNQPV
jgi:hypothetical protein